MRRHKYAAPVVIVTLLGLYYIAFAVAAAHIRLPLPAKLACILIPLAFCGVLISVLVERIREIKSGEEDDLDKY